jgi:hypothetical protein
MFPFSNLVAVFLSLSLTPILKPVAYLDPGSGSFLIQLLIGALVGMLVLLKSYWSRIRGFFTKGAKKDNLPTNEPTEDGRSQSNAS